MSSLNEKKESLRQQVLSERQQMDEEEWLHKSNQIIQSLLDTQYYNKASTVHTYVSMNKRREVCTDRLLKHLLDNHKRTVVPVTNFQEGTLNHSEINSLDDLEKNKWGVAEPKSVHPVNIESLDLIIVPMAAADRSGNRLGYGKGFYDRFLSETKALKAGLIFSDFLFEEIPVGEFDIKLDVIITEDEMIFA